MEAQLNAAMHEFVTSPRHVHVDAGAESVSQSKIFDWFEGDFLAYLELQGQGKPVILNYINLYRGANDQIPTAYSVRYFPYDKRINQQ